MGTTPIRPLVNRVLEGHLDEVLRRYAAEGLSPSRMSLRLASEYQVEVSGQTVKKWLHGLRTQDQQTASTAQNRPTARNVCTTQTAQAAQTARTAQSGAEPGRVGS